MENSAMLNAAIVGIFAFFAYMVLDGFLRRKKMTQQILDRAAADTATSYDMSGGAEALVSLDRKMSDTAAALDSMLRSFGVNVDAATRKLRGKFNQAGLMSPDGPIYYLFFQRVVSLVVVAIALLFFASNAEGMEYILHMMLGIFLVVMGIFGPYIVVQNMIQKRAQLLQNSFPDALDLLLVCVESGLALDAAMARICTEMGTAHPEITQEMNRTRLELALLNDRVQALTNLGERTGLLPFRSLVAALIQTERFGTSLADTLRVLSEDYRLTRLMRAENKAGRLPALMTIPLIVFLMPAFILIILGPSIVRVMAQGGIFAGINN